MCVQLKGCIPLHGVPAPLFECIDDNIVNAVACAERIKNEISAVTQLTILSSVQLCPKPLYRQGPKSCRLNGIGCTFVSMEKSVREVLTSSWTQIDLQHAQLSIIAHSWKIPLVQNFLASKKQLGLNVWEVFADYAGVEFNKDVKKAIKASLYGTVNGLTAVGASVGLGKVIGEGPATKLVHHPVYKALREASKARLDWFLQEKKLVDAVGQEFELGPHVRGNTHRQQTYSAFANEEQSYEMAVLAPVFQYAKSSERTDRPVWVMGWLHDGLFIHCEPQFRDHHVKQIRRLIKVTSADLLGAEMDVDIELPESPLTPKQISTLRSLYASNPVRHEDFDFSALIPETV